MYLKHFMVTGSVDRDEGEWVPWHRAGRGRGSTKSLGQETDNPSRLWGLHVGMEDYGGIQ